jgi:hypothetical protein
MVLSVSELKEELPEFSEIDLGDTISVDGVAYQVVEKETQSPSPGERVRYLHLNAEDQTKVLSWGTGQTVESVWIYEEGTESMTDGVEVQQLQYSYSEE